MCSIIQAQNPFILIDIKQALQEQNYSQVKELILYYLLCQVILQVLEYVQLKYYWNTHNEIKQQIQKSILEHLFSLDIQFFEENKVTYLSNVVQEGANQISEQISYGKISEKLNDYTEIISQVIFIYLQSPHLLVLLSILALASSIVNSKINAKKQLAEKNQDFQSEYKNFALDDIITNIHLIKIFNQEKQEIQNLNKIIHDNCKYQQETEYYKQIKTIFGNFTHDSLKISIILFLLISGIEDPQNKKIVLNSLAEIISYTFSIILLFKDISKLFVKKPSKYYHKKYKYIGKVMKLFETNPQIKDNFMTEKPVQYLKGNIKFENVNFIYPQNEDSLLNQNQFYQQNDDDSLEEIQLDQDSLQKQESTEHLENREMQTTNLQTNSNGLHNFERKNVLQNVSFEIKSGQLIAFVGMSGSGKSTIVKLIERYYDIQEGTILLDNQNIKDICLKDLRRSIGLVNQEPSLFDNDIEYNITYGCIDAKYTQEELRQVCDVSGVSEFVCDNNRFPLGLKTLVGAKGMKLSGGQKQRIAIARALMKKPSILILDEATSSLDSESENLVQTYIDQLMGYRGITIIQIAHRLSTIVKSDIIFVMENGQIKEQGTHEQLLLNEGVYKKLIHHQINIIK
ncbi:hypothetical protein ABPG74_015357 [Tetrahymena malaccensis]